MSFDGEKAQRLNYKNSELTDKIGAMVDSDALMIPVDQMKQTSLMVSDSVSEVRQLAEDVKGSVDDVRNSSEELKTSVKATMDNAILTMRRENREIAEHLEYIRSTVDNIKTPSEEDEALKAIAEKAQEQRTGARGLRGIMEGILTDLMFETPSDNTIEKIIITKEVVTDSAQPQIIHKIEKPSFPVKLSKKELGKRSKRSSAS